MSGERGGEGEGGRSRMRCGESHSPVSSRGRGGAAPRQDPVCPLHGTGSKAGCASGASHPNADGREQCRDAGQMRHFFVCVAGEALPRCPGGACPCLFSLSPPL